jgi:hypothetical protein
VSRGKSFWIEWRAEDTKGRKAGLARETAGHRPDALTHPHTAIAVPSTTARCKIRVKSEVQWQRTSNPNTIRHFLN